MESNPSILHHLNDQRLSPSAEAAAATCVERLSNWGSAIKEIQSWPEYEAQPLRSLSNTAKQIGIRHLYFKDESLRFGMKLGSLKALGAPYAVYRILAKEVQARTGLFPSSKELRLGTYRYITDQVTVCAATDGNQGRRLAYGAKTFGCRCVDYIHSHVSENRANVMKELGAIVICIDGEYEASVERAREDARMNGWYFVSSTSWNDFDDPVPQDVMNAYMMVVEETLNMLPAVEDITHVFVCGGVGSIAAAVFLGFWNDRLQEQDKHYLANLPRFIIVEPSEADCLFQSAKRRELCASEGSLRTLMAGLACRVPSPAAMKIHSWLTSDFVTVPDSVAVEGMTFLASGKSGDIPIVCGESSAASMGVLLRVGANSSLHGKLELHNDSNVVLFGLEGATDSFVFEELVGMTPASVFETQKDFAQTR